VGCSVKKYMEVMVNQATTDTSVILMDDKMAFKIMVDKRAKVASKEGITSCRKVELDMTFVIIH
jgi:hypothetical protein